ncbi:MAG: hypothetical protein JST89_18905 [Cyanobacteria bacterium SZAS-4]|nr:hypothetical protein [Cyanobacteria bacterium SZAS-4]
MNQNYGRPYISFIPASAAGSDTSIDVGVSTVESFPAAKAPARTVAKTLLENESVDLKKLSTAARQRNLAKTLIDIVLPAIATPEVKKKALTGHMRKRPLKTLMDAGSVDPKAIRRLLQSEFGSTPNPEPEPIQSKSEECPEPAPAKVEVAKTLMDCFIPAPVVDEISPRRQFMAKTRLDRRAIAEVVMRFEQRKEQRDAEQADALAEAIAVELVNQLDNSDALDAIENEDEFQPFLPENRHDLLAIRQMFMAIVALAIVSLLMMAILPPAASPSDSPLTLKLWASSIRLPNLFDNSQS